MSTQSDLNTNNLPNVLKNDGLGTVVSFPPFAFPKGDTPLTEDDVAKRFADEYSERLRYDHERGFWVHWNEYVWELDRTEKAFHYVRIFCRKLRGSEHKMSSAASVASVERMARCDPKFAVTSEIWDRNKYLLGTPAGTVDLKTGELKPACLGDYITQSTTVAAAPIGTPSPIFDKFLNEITGGDAELKRFLRMWFGYCLTGDTKLQCLLFIYGTGGNGKGILMNAIIKIMGTYAVSAALDTFTASKQPRHLTELAMLMGKRLVTVSETDKGQAWSESRINQVTGGDPVTANYMRKDHFTYIPQFKLTISGNHKPKLKSINEAATRRYNMVPFNHKPKVPDSSLADKLLPEYPAILRWAIEGCLDWLENGLVKPKILIETTADYFDEQNLLKQWILAKCETAPNLKCSSKALFNSWIGYCDENKEHGGTQTNFGMMLKSYGFQSHKSSGSYYLGITVKSDGIATLSYGSLDDLESKM